MDPRPPHDQPQERGPAPDCLGEPAETGQAGTWTSIEPDVAAEVTSLLAAAGRLPDEADLTATDAMPSDVADRIMVAIAAKARLRVDPGPLTPTERGATVTPFV
ncbi:MAG: hypothetical protein ABIQ53_07725, partial [Terracoccus sp.]